MARSRVEQQVRQLYEMCAIAIVAGRADLDGADEVGFDIELPVFTVGRAAELANVHPQTLRQYDRLGLVVPQRTGGGTYSALCRRSNSVRKRASIWLESRGSSNLKRRIVNCADRWSGCASRPAPAYSRLTRTVASWKSNVLAGLACGGGMSIHANCHPDGADRVKARSPNPW